MSSSLDYDKFHHQHVEARRNDPRSNDELIQLALHAKDDYEWADAVSVLQYRPASQLLKIARQLSASEAPLERTLGAKILSQGSIPESERVPPDESLAVLLHMLEHEQDPELVLAIGTTLGDLADPRSVEPLIRLADHPDATVRSAAVHGLLHQRDERAIATLIALSRDEDVDIRDWATFGLAQMEEIDTPAVREALWARVTDKDDDTRSEALAGLALRGDARVIEPLLQELESVGDEAGEVMYEAAIEAGKRISDPRLYEPLLRLQALNTHSYADPDELAEAIAKSKPSVPRKRRHKSGR